MWSQWPLSLTQPDSYAFAVPLYNRTNSTKSKCWCLAGRVTQCHRITAIQTGSRNIGRPAVKSLGHVRKHERGKKEGLKRSSHRRVRLKECENRLPVENSRKRSIRPTWRHRNREERKKRKRWIRLCGAATTHYEKKKSLEEAHGGCSSCTLSTTWREQWHFTSVCVHIFRELKDTLLKKNNSNCIF